jgi:cyclopropane fatty-acyl-phospholipid synthase-like methyltransferase
MARAIAYKKALIWGIEDREYFFRVGIGIMNSESTLGTKYAGTCDKSYNNFGGIKYRILDTGKAVHDQPIPQNGCWMYKFATIEDYFGSKYNSLGKGY